jgi:hypothetical protein
MNDRLHRTIEDLRVRLPSYFVFYVAIFTFFTCFTGVTFKAVASESPIGTPAYPSLSPDEFIQTVDEEYGYRQALEAEAPKWVRELMYIYKWTAKYPVPISHFNGGNRPTPEEARLRMASEFAWLTITGHALLATFDFQHAEQSLLGSTSRVVATLMKSKAFWVEVRKQCLELANPEGPKACAERFQRDLKISQLVGSNVSLFVGGGIVISLGKKIFRKYLSSWFAARVLPLIPMAARSKWVLGTAVAAIVILPAGFVVASLEKEKETSRQFLENLPEALKETQTQAEKESVLRMKSLELERDVFELAIWINQRLPNQKEVRSSLEELQSNQVEAERFVAELKLFGPRFSTLQQKRNLVLQIRDATEQELRRLPNASQRLLEIAEKRKHGMTSEEDSKLFRKAQYLAALRLVSKVL